MALGGQLGSELSRRREAPPTKRRLLSGHELYNDVRPYWENPILVASLNVASHPKL